MNRYSIFLSAPAAVFLAACGSTRQAQVGLPSSSVSPATYVVSAGTPYGSTAQSGNMSIPANSHLVFRTHEGIDASAAMDQSFYAEVAKDVFDSSGRVLIPSGSPAKLVVMRTENIDKVTGMPELVLGLRAIMVNGQDYGLSPTGWTTADMQPSETIIKDRAEGYDSRQMSSNPESELRDDRVTGYSNLPGYDPRRADMRGYDPRGYVDPRDYLRRSDRTWQGTGTGGMIVGVLVSAVPGHTGSSSVIGTPTGAYRDPDAGTLDTQTGAYRGSYSDSATPIYGAGAGVTIRGTQVRVPANSVLTFRLDQPLELFVGVR